MKHTQFDNKKESRFYIMNLDENISNLLENFEKPPILGSGNKYDPKNIELMKNFQVISPESFCGRILKGKIPSIENIFDARIKAKNKNSDEDRRIEYVKKEPSKTKEELKEQKKIQYYYKKEPTKTEKRHIPINFIYYNQQKNSLYKVAMEYQNRMFQRYSNLEEKLISTNYYKRRFFWGIDKEVVGYYGGLRRYH